MKGHMVRWSNLFIFPLFMRKCTSHKVVTRNYEKSTSILKMRATTSISQGRWQEKHFLGRYKFSWSIITLNIHPHFLRDVIHACLPRVREGFRIFVGWWRQDTLPPPWISPPGRIPFNRKYRRKVLVWRAYCVYHLERMYLRHGIMSVKSQDGNRVGTVPQPKPSLATSTDFAYGSFFIW